MKLYVLSIENPREFSRVVRLLEKHNISYYPIIIVVSENRKARILGGIISQYKVEKLTLDDILVYILSNSQ